MATHISDQLQPSLLDRLTNAQPVGEDLRVMSKRQLRQAVLRDLTTLLNTVQPRHPGVPDDSPLAATVINFGLPSLAGELTSRFDLAEWEDKIATAIRRFEPRIRPDTLRVRAIRPKRLLETHNVIEFHIQGELWSHPVSQEFLLRTHLNLEAGQVAVADTTQQASPATLRGANR